ncbi:MAG: glutamate 5-kinase, partial [Atopobiaceae bacterium]|nr:glutamate 5-kinase [Atopobiaceae bacterium]
VVVDVAHGEPIGTRFEAPVGSSHEAARKFWIGLAGVSRGRLTIDDGARRALVEQGGSLLPVGVTSVEGDFSAGDVVSVLDRYGGLVGRGAVRYSSDELAKARGLRLEVIERFLPELAGQPCIHRDELLLF